MQTFSHCLIAVWVILGRHILWFMKVILREVGRENRNWALWRDLQSITWGLVLPEHAQRMHGKLRLQGERFQPVAPAAGKFATRKTTTPGKCSGRQRSAGLKTTKSPKSGWKGKQILWREETPSVFPWCLSWLVQIWSRLKEALLLRERGKRLCKPQWTHTSCIQDLELVSQAELLTHFSRNL